MQTITVSNTTLFEIASRYLGDATKWDLIAVLNGMSDPWIEGLTVLRIPDPQQSVADG